jgi:hypothetical protein
MRKVKINRQGARTYGAIHLEGREAEVIWAGVQTTKVRMRRLPLSPNHRKQRLDREMVFANHEVDVIREEIVA